ncbi:MAG TPA: GspE/PulE family protein [Bacteroidota bacterium]|nr:GspE/PulE family protein [Bacteroidota bacterium]
MTPEEQQFLKALTDRRLLDRDLLTVRRAAFEALARDKGVTRALAATFGLSEEILADTLCKTFKGARMPIAVEIETAPEQILTEDEIFRLRVLPVFLIGLELTMAFIDPPSRQVINQLQKLTGHRVIPVFTTITDFDAAMKKYHGAIDRIQSLKSNVELEKYDIRNRKPSVSMMEQAGEPTVAELVEELLLRAAKAGASDIHVEPTDDELMIRFRVDGVLRREVSFPTSFHPGMVSVLKSKSGMDMFERSIPQDGRFALQFADRQFDVRVNSLPLLNGEKIVLRLLGKTSMMIDLDNLGFSDKNLRHFRSLLHLPNGIILVSGPTGSGKTTTLYSSLNEIKDIATNITTVENPVEYKLPLINQVQVMSERGLTFGSSLRAILRQDPDVILVGEIRDAETGLIATEAALTGHLVLSTIHTNDAIGAISRMINLGIASFWVSASVIGVVAQRLVRRICARCKEEFLPTKDYLEFYGLSELSAKTTLFRGKGCSFCSGTGYKGRIALHEVFIVTDEMRDVIYGEVTTSKLRELAIANNFRDMYYDGMMKAIAGITTVEEVQRVTRRLA